MTGISPLPQHKNAASRLLDWRHKIFKLFTVLLTGSAPGSDRGMFCTKSSTKYAVRFSMPVIRQSFEFPASKTSSYVVSYVQ